MIDDAQLDEWGPHYILVTPPQSRLLAEALEMALRSTAYRFSADERAIIVKAANRFRRYVSDEGVELGAKYFQVFP